MFVLAIDNDELLSFGYIGINPTEIWTEILAIISQ